MKYPYTNREELRTRIAAIEDQIEYYTFEYLSLKHLIQDLEIELKLLEDEYENT